MRRVAPYLLGLFGLAVIAAGVAMVYVPAALIVTGAAVVGIAVLTDDGRDGP